MSVPQKSLSIEPTMPTMFKWLNLDAWSGVISPNQQPIYSFLMWGKCALYLTFRGKISYQFGPLLTEQICSSKRSVTTNDNQVGDTLHNKIFGGTKTTGTLAKILAASRSDNSTSLEKKSCDNCLKDSITSLKPTL